MEYRQFKTKIGKCFSYPFRCYNKQGYYSEEMSIAGMLDLSQKEIIQNLDNKNYNAAVLELLAIVETIGNLYENYDDLEGIISNECQKSVSLLLDIFKNELECPKDVKVNALNVINRLVQNSIYEDFDLGDINGLLLLLSMQLSSFEDGLHLLEEKISSSESWKKTVHIHTKIELLIENGKISEAEKCIDENIEIPEIRKYKIGRLIDNGEIQKVAECLKEGLILAEKEHSQKLENEWKDLLLDVYVDQNEIENIILLAEDLFYHGYDPRRYFLVLKRYTHPDEWDTTLRRIVASFHEPKRYGGINNIKAWIFINEEMWDALWELVCKGNIDTIFKYERELMPHFAEKMITAITIKVKDFAEQSSNTTHYLFVANVLRKMRLYPDGDSIVDKLLIEFFFKYEQQKEFLDILRGV
ncbi:MAG: hypothetical protein FWH18_09440 [Marinilabiliaceae bacterium]|nr:hypothetical protein [Marinilabiliaceae bacterium]